MGVVQAGPADEAPPTPVEQAVIDYECTATRTTAATDAEYEACLNTRLAVLRGAFGRDLGQLSQSDRRTIDSYCASVGAARGRDARVQCLSNELGARRLLRSRTNPLPVGPEPPPPAEDAPVPGGKTSARALSLWIGAGFLTVASVAGGLAFVARKRRQVLRKCRSCGGVAEAGELCSSCRHAAADALRRATADRADEERLAAEERQREAERHEERRREAERRVEEVRQVEEAHVRRLEALQKEKAEDELRSRQEDIVRQRSQNTAASLDQEFDPYAILGVARDATRQDIAAAYEKARARLNPELTTHLNEELRTYFARKADGVERAYQILTGAENASTMVQQSAPIVADLSSNSE
jgi:hypothetical protein